MASIWAVLKLFSGLHGCLKQSADEICSGCRYALIGVAFNLTRPNRALHLRETHPRTAPQNEPTRSTLHASDVQTKLPLPALCPQTIKMSSSANFVAPGQQRYLRACMVCSIVMTYSVRGIPTAPSTVPPCMCSLLLTCCLNSDSVTKAARIAKSFSISPAPRTRSRAAHLRCLRASSRLQTRPSHGWQSGSASMATSRACMPSRSLANCRMRFARCWKTSTGYSTFRKCSRAGLL